jgi:hypothetical protein
MLAHYVGRVTHQEGNLYWQVGKGSRNFVGKTINFREQYGCATQEALVERDEPGP